MKEGYFKNIKAMLALFEKKLGDHPWFVGENVCTRMFLITLVMLNILKGNAAK